jgi:spore germination cell wall hydrolase CwlJ-like protein
MINRDDLATVTIFGEAAGEPDEGKSAVAFVIRERMRLKFFSDGTVAGTVLAPYQFSMWNTTEKLRIKVCNTDPYDAAAVGCRFAWLGAMSHPNLPPGTVMYFNPKAVTRRPEWADSPEFRFVRVIGNHHFYQKVSLANL